VDFPYIPQPRQQLAHASTADEIFYGGAAGGGKSAWLGWDAIDFCAKIPELNAFMFRRTFAQLRMNHIMQLKRDIPDELAIWNESAKEFRFYNGSILIFRHCEHEGDLDDMQGAEIHWGGIDEAAQFTPNMLGYIRSRIRLGRAEERILRLAENDPSFLHYIEKLPRLCLGSNPGGEAHHYLKANYIDPAPAETVFEDRFISELTGKEIIKTKIFIPAKMTDNRFLDAGYEIQFSDLPKWQQAQLVSGDWNIVPGSFFDCYNSNLHVVAPFAIPTWWQRFRSLDWGYATPFSVGWWAVADDTKVTAKDGVEYQFEPGTIIRYREWYGAKKDRKNSGYLNQGLRMEPEKVAEQIRMMETGETIAYGVADPSLWRGRDGGKSNAERFAEKRIYWQPAANDRQAGSTQMYARMNTNTLFVFDTCTEFQRLVPAVVTDEKKPEEYKKVGEDHLPDEVRYACMSRPSIRRAPELPKQGYVLPTMDDLNNLTRSQEQNWL